MDEILYLESDEEITSVIDKLKGLEAKSVGLVAPKGSAIVQSVVSLKLLKKEAEELKKDIAIVTSDEVGRNLSAQVGLIVYADVKSQRPLSTPEVKKPEAEPIEIDMSGEDENLPEAFQVHRYDESGKGEEKEAPKPEGVEAPTDSAGKKLEKLENQETRSAGKEAESKIEEQAPTPQREASGVGVPTSDSKDQSVGKFIKRPVAETFDRNEREEIESSRPVKMEGPISKPKSKKLKKFKIALVSALGVIVLLGGVLALDLLAAKLDVNISVLADTIDKTVELSAEKDRQVVDPAGAAIPGSQIVIEKTFDNKFDSTGEKDAGSQAKGTLTFKNDAGVDETIPSGVTISSSSGTGFTLDNQITVPAATLNPQGDKVSGSTTGSVTAKNNGSDGNLPASTSYVISGRPKISTSGATTGGVTKKIKYVTKSDIERAKKELQNRQESDFLNDYKKAPGEVILDGAGKTESLDFSTDKSSGDETETFNAKAKTRFTTMSFKEDDFKNAVVAMVKKDLPQGKSLILTPEDSIKSNLKDSQVNVGKIVISGKLISHVGPDMDVQKLVKSWRGKPIKNIRNDLSKIPDLTIKSVDLSPNYALPLAPALTRHIKVNIEYTKK